ncbi:leucine-rich repeat protein [Candidatus Izemoplasma sp. B36]|uniref:leucine-rich repeat protein n=1 Tax=Candidatus Izemoplasma sp. B36 TaxID=3242468 RepID=UPI003555C058
MKKLIRILCLGLVVFFYGCSLIGSTRITINFVSNGGSEVKSIKHSLGSELALPEDPVRDHYVFYGWFMDDDIFMVPLESDLSPFFTSSDITSITVYAKWVHEDVVNSFFTVSYETNGGTVVSSESVQYDHLATIPNDPTKNGMEFAGWYLDPDLLEYYLFDETITEDITLYADWGTAGLEYTTGSYGIQVSKGSIGNIDTVVIPNRHEGKEVVTLKQDAFINSPSVKTIVISNTLMYLEMMKNDTDYYFSEFIVSNNNPYYSSLDGVLYSKDFSTLIFYPRYKTDEYFEVPSETEIIGSVAFKYNKYLKEILISDSVELIEIGAFIYAESLEVVEFLDDSHLEEIKWNAFSEIETLKSVVIPESVTTMGGYIFTHSYYVTIYIEAQTQPSGWDQYWDEEPSSTYGVEGHNLVWGYVRKSHTDDLFYAVTSFDTVIITSYNYSSSNTVVIIPETIEDKPVTRILRYAFAYNTLIEEITLPNSLIVIERYAFRQATNLEIVNLGDNPSLEEIHVGAFEYTPLSYFEFPDSLLIIEEYAFIACPLKNIYLPDSITTIGFAVFNQGDTYYNVFAEVDSKPNGWVDGFANRESKVFWGVDGLVDEGDISYALTANNTAVVLGYKEGATEKDVTILESIQGHNVVEIQPHAFQNSNLIETLNLPSTLEIIGEQAFMDCQSLQTVYFEDNSNLDRIDRMAFFQTTSLKYFVIPDGVTTIGIGAFLWTFQLSHVFIPDSVTNIGLNAFNYGYGKVVFVETNSIPNGWDQDWIIETEQRYINPIIFNTKSYQENDTFKYVILSDNTISILGLVPGCDLVDVIIPDSIGSLVVSKLEIASFFNNTDLKSVEIADSILSIGNYAFASCYHLDEVIISSSSQLTYIGAEAFTSLGNIEFIYIPISVTYIGDNAFQSIIYPIEIRVAAPAYVYTWSSIWNPDHHTVIWNYTLSD